MRGGSGSGSSGIGVVAVMGGDMDGLELELDDVDLGPVDDGVLGLADLALGEGDSVLNLGPDDGVLDLSELALGEGDGVLDLGMDDGVLGEFGFLVGLELELGLGSSLLDDCGLAGGSSTSGSALGAS